MSYHGKFVPKNKSKYRGKIDNITYRSLWELAVMKHLDNNPHVKWWNSECTVIPYFSEADQKKRRYFMDFTLCYEDGSVHMWEVKPAAQCQPPKPPQRMTAAAKNNYLNALHTWQTNLCKWKAAKSLCDKKGFTFKIITEKTLRSHFGAKI